MKYFLAKLSSRFLVSLSAVAHLFNDQLEIKYVAYVLFFRFQSAAGDIRSCICDIALRASSKCSTGNFYSVSSSLYHL